MKRYTKAQRRKIYEKVLAMIRKRPTLTFSTGFGFREIYSICLELHDLTSLSIPKIPSVFKELAMMKPEVNEDTSYFWDRYAKEPRETALLFMIEMTKD